MLIDIISRAAVIVSGIERGGVLALHLRYFQIVARYLSRIRVLSRTGLLLCLILPCQSIIASLGIITVHRGIVSRLRTVVCRIVLSWIGIAACLAVVLWLVTTTRLIAVP